MGVKEVKAREGEMEILWASYQIPPIHHPGQTSPQTWPQGPRKLFIWLDIILASPTGQLFARCT